MTARSIRTKNYQNLAILLQDTIDNVGILFTETQWSRIQPTDDDRLCV